MSPVLLSDVKVRGAVATYTPNGGSARVLGYTQDGWTLSGKQHLVDVKVHELGETIIKRVKNGYEMTIEGALAVSSLENTALSMGGTKTTVTGTPDKISYDLSPVAGGSEIAFGKLVLHPSDLASSNVSEDWTFFKVSAGEGTGQPFKFNGAMFVPVKFTVHPEQNATTGDVRFACHGDALTAVYYTLPGS